MTRAMHLQAAACVGGALMNALAAGFAGVLIAYLVGACWYMHTRNWSVRRHAHLDR